VRKYFAISDILVFPSYREGFPNVVMQAGAMGLPSIVTDINGCNEIIADGINGMIIPSKDKNILKEKMELLIDDDIMRNKMRYNARKMIVSRYEQKIVWDTLLKEYQSLTQ
jgi:glycosyltransferase involved in cell wall biosynthesis